MSASPTACSQRCSSPTSSARPSGQRNSGCALARRARAPWRGNPLRARPLWRQRGEVNRRRLPRHVRRPRAGHSLRGGDTRRGTWARNGDQGRHPHRRMRGHGRRRRRDRDPHCRPRQRRGNARGDPRSRTVRDLVVGSGIAFEERGAQTLKGVPGEWSLLAVVPEGAAQESPEVKITKIDTPSPRETMRRSDRIAAAVARRAPGALAPPVDCENRRRARQAP